MASKHTSGAAQALYRVFVVPAYTRPVSTRQLTQLSPKSPSPRCRHGLRSFSTTTLRSAKSRPPEERVHKQDDEIKARMLYLVDPETNKREEEPRSRWEVMSTLDRKTHRLFQLSPDDPKDPYFVPVCKIQSKKDAYAQEKQRKQAQKDNKAKSAKMNSVKTLELNWAIDLNDLDHRLEKVAEFLAEGRRVEIVLASKKRGRKASSQECEAVLKKIKDCVGSVPNAQELKGLEGSPGGFASLVLQGGSPSS
ncbi:hypothetical protein B0A50_07601 [Salinomyces thailandicus]|uniref:Uncharacterized protein n=1 Tax=Salinomyces thailandicus TaxID=706561 RepID=A0A4U0TMK7_9PEZI|nr:hypothetical protein B0A50_07601 [Salinomyces thailandica]